MLLSHADGSQELGELGAFSVAAIFFFAKPPAVQHNANFRDGAFGDFFGNTHPHHHNLRVNGGPRFTAENELL